jgi:hypothetical protein
VAEIDLSTDSLIAAVRSRTLPTDENTETIEKAETITEADNLISEKIDEFVAILDDPEAAVNRDELQVEIQKLQSFQAELEALKAPLAEAETESAEPDQNEIAESIESTESESEEMDTATEIPSEEMAELPTVVDEAQMEISPDSLPQTAPTEEDIAMASAPQITDEQRAVFEEILSISEGFVIDFDRKANVLIEDGDLQERELKALADLNNTFVASIDTKIDSLNAIKTLGGSDFKRTIEREIEELQALSADKQQEYDRLMAEAELIAMESEEPVADATDELTERESDLKEIREIPDLNTIQYKSLNASIIRNGLKTKTDSLRLLQDKYSEVTSAEEKSDILAEMDRITAEVNRGITQSNLAEINYYQSENTRILSQLDANKSTNREEIIALQSRATELKAKSIKLEKTEDVSMQQALISDLSDVNNQLAEFASAESESATSELAELGDFSNAMLKPESHETLPNKAYLTEMQSMVITEMSPDLRKRLIENDEELDLTLDFASGESVEEKRGLISANTKVDSIGLELLAESPAQFDYLVAMVRADSLKNLERQSAEYAELQQIQAVERSTEADRLLKMIPNQETEKDRESVKARAKKLEEEAEVLYKKSALAAVQAELIRAKRSQNDEKLIALSTDLSFKQRKALDALLLKPGYRIIPSEEPVAVVDESLGKANTPAEIPSSVVTEAESTDKVVINEKPTTPELKSEGLDAVKGNWLGMVEIIAEKDDFSDVEESMFVEAETGTYDSNKPIPIDPAMPDGLIFQVQVGAYRNPIPQDLFGPYAPIMGQKLANGITRYRAGLFKKYAEALQARNEIRTKGYSDAFVVVYVDGEKLTGEQAREILAQARETEKVSVELIKGIPSGEPIAVKAEEKEPELNTSYYNDPEAAEAEQVEIIAGLFYTVQVGVYSKPVKLDQLYNLTELNSELTASGVIRYTSGRFGDLSAASTRKEVARNKGVNDAFITAYYNGKRVSLAEAERLIAEKGESVFAEKVAGEKPADVPPPNVSVDEEKDNGESYVVIMGTFVDNVPQELADLFLENKNWGIRKIQGPGSAAIYLSEDIKSLDEARALLKECKKLNISTATLGTMKDGKITSVQIE